MPQKKNCVGWTVRLAGHIIRPLSDDPKVIEDYLLQYHQAVWANLVTPYIKYELTRESKIVGFCGGGQDQGPVQTELCRPLQGQKRKKDAGDFPTKRVRFRDGKTCSDLRQRGEHDVRHLALHASLIRIRLL